MVRSYEDKACSGADEDRPGLWKAVTGLRRGMALVVWKFDRLARDAFLFFAIEKRVRAAGCSIVSASGERTITDALSASEELHYRILVLFADYERKVIALRTSQAMKRRQSLGQRMSNLIPYGWKLDPRDRTRLLPNPEERRIVALIVGKAAAGKGPRVIIRELTAAGETYREGRPWHPENVRRILRRGDQGMERL